MKRFVKDDFLESEDHNNIIQLLTGSEFPWYVKSEGVSGTDRDGPLAYYFTHTFYTNYNICSPYFKILVPIIEKITPKALVRIKANLYPRTTTLEKHGFHEDQPFDVKSCLYYVNTNDGITTFEDTMEEVNSVANRALFFNSHYQHCSSTCTNQKYRLTINFNYF
jgi:hypothetical protein